MATTELPPTDARPEDDPLPDLAIPQIAPSNGSNGSRDLSETVITDRDLLQTLLAVDGRRTVQEIAAGRGPQAQTHLQSLAAQGLIRIELPTPPAAPAGPAARRPYRWRRRRPRTASRSICPKLGFWDNAASHYSRPTQLHRCFASGSPAPLTAGQQEHLCLTGAFSTCPRLGGTEAGAEPRAEARPDGAPSGPAVPSAPGRPWRPSPLWPLKRPPTSAAPETGPGAGRRLGLSVRTLSPIAALSAAEGVTSPEPSGAPASDGRGARGRRPSSAEASASGPTPPGAPARLPSARGQPPRRRLEASPPGPTARSAHRCAPRRQRRASGGGQAGRWVALGSAGLAAVLAAVLAVRLFVPGGPPPTPTSTQAVRQPGGAGRQAQSPARGRGVPLGGGGAGVAGAVPPGLRHGGLRQGVPPLRPGGAALPGEAGREAGPGGALRALRHRGQEPHQRAAPGGAAADRRLRRPAHHHELLRPLGRPPDGEGDGHRGRVRRGGQGHRAGHRNPHLQRPAGEGGGLLGQQRERVPAVLHAAGGGRPGGRGDPLRPGEPQPGGAALPLP